MNTVRKELEIVIWGMGLIFLEKRREWQLPNIMYIDDMVLCGESEEDWKGIIRMFC